VTHSEASRSENVGTSNRNAGEIPARRKTKVSFAMIISEGLVGPKEMTKVGSDGQMVNIPSPVYISMERRRTHVLAHYWICVVGTRVIGQVNPPMLDSVQGKFLASAWEIRAKSLPRKSSKIRYKEPVP
jgi:hypothetical protein